MPAKGHYSLYSRGEIIFNIECSRARVRGNNFVITFVIPFYDHNSLILLCCYK